MSWAEVKNNNSSSENKVDFTKIEAGETVTLRVLDAEPYSRWTHWLQSHKRGITCAGKGCPICEIIKQQKANKIPATYSSAKRHILHVWNYGTQCMELFEQGNTVFETLCTFHETVGDLRNYDIKVVRKGKDKDTTYTVIPMAQTPVDSAIKETYEAEKIDFAEWLKPPTVEEAQRIINGESFDDVFGNQEEATQEATNNQNESTDEEVSFVTK